MLHLVSVAKNMQRNAHVGKSAHPYVTQDLDYICLFSSDLDNKKMFTPTFNISAEFFII